MLSSVFSCKHSLSPISKTQASLRIQEFDESLYLYVYQLFRCYLIIFHSAAMERTFLQKIDKNVLIIANMCPPTPRGGKVEI